MRKQLVTGKRFFFECQVLGQDGSQTLRLMSGYTKGRQILLYERSCGGRTLRQKSFVALAELLPFEVLEDQQRHMAI